MSNDQQYLSKPKNHPIVSEYFYGNPPDGFSLENDPMFQLFLSESLEFSSILANYQYRSSFLFVAVLLLMHSLHSIDIIDTQ